MLDTAPSATTTEASARSRFGRIDVRALAHPPVLIFNPNAGHKLGLTVTESGGEAAQAALRGAGIAFEPRPTERPGHATELARQAVREGRELVIAAGGDGTVGEVAQALAGTEAVLAVMPLGSVMNTARTLCIPRDLNAAAGAMLDGNVLAMDLGRVGNTYFLEGSGVGLDAGLFGYFDRLESGARLRGVLRGAIRFLRRLGTPLLHLEIDGRPLAVRAPMVAVANSPFIGAAYTIAPDAKIDDGLLDVVVFREASVLRVLLHLLSVAGARRRPLPPDIQAFQARSVRITTRRRRPLPIHADGTPIGATPASFEVVPAALRVIVGRPPEGACAWQRPDNMQCAAQDACGV